MPTTSVLAPSGPVSVTFHPLSRGNRILWSQSWSDQSGTAVAAMVSNMPGEQLLAVVIDEERRSMSRCGFGTLALPYETLASVAVARGRQTQAASRFRGDPFIKKPWEAFWHTPFRGVDRIYASRLQSW